MFHYERLQAYLFIQLVHQEGLRGGSAFPQAHTAV